MSIPPIIVSSAKDDIEKKGMQQVKGGVFAPEDIEMLKKENEDLEKENEDFRKKHKDFRKMFKDVKKNNNQILLVL